MSEAERIVWTECCTILSDAEPHIRRAARLLCALPDSHAKDKLGMFLRDAASFCRLINSCTPVLTT